jgi:hypothetical protein
MQVCSRPIIDEDERGAIAEAQTGNKEHLQDGNTSDLIIVTTPSKAPRGWRLAMFYSTDLCT